MTDVRVTPEVLEAFTGTNVAMATAVGAAGSINAAANTAIMVPVFGLIGQEFLAAFIAAQVNHLTSVGELAAVHAATAASTAAGLATFETTDGNNAAVIRSAL
ncbi:MULTISPECIES: type VII secretion target [unclassified Gordonia (in: high G+C Gram-positive bacteria)]|uniref:type VII secretion target n=1 Tax=unclassified Gordonia (in: high G+C Gram-positive bacteria) TaxID=2657482 RepID=UPI001F115F89|nr:type VII secretion target [Gordonia sp. ABSL49_1]MCH5642226.1 type VII secretion target [Gordonia sp. ABSL49_1]